MAQQQKQRQSGQNLARVSGSICAGIAELLIFHPVDTVAKRLMTNRESIRGRLSQVVFRDAHGKPMMERYRSLFPGLGFAAGYKVTQRLYKFGGQPIVKDYINTHYADVFQRNFSERNAKIMMQGTAGSLIGIGEIFLLPLDVLKIRAQANPQAIAGRGVVEIFKREGFALYRGAGWTALRNAPGSFALFGANSMTMEYLFHNDNPRNATFLQFATGSIVGSTASIVVAQPFDVIKTRVQARPFDSPESGMSVIRNLLKNEGFSALFKGVVPKVAIVGPKLVFSFTIAQYLIAHFEKAFA